MIRYIQFIIDEHVDNYIFAKIHKGIIKYYSLLGLYKSNQKVLLSPESQRLILEKYKRMLMFTLEGKESKYSHIFFVEPNLNIL